MSEELVKRLRSRREAEMIGGYERVEWEDEDALEAADRIEAQAAEIRRLREALEPFAKSGDLLVVAEDKGDFWAYRPAGGDEYGITGRHLLAARAALGETR